MISPKGNKSLRQSFADTMVAVGKRDPHLVVLIGDISHHMLQPFAKACPGRFYNIGICEPAMVNMAAGLAKVGLHPVVHTIAPFIVERSFEQIKLDFGYQELGVNLVTVGSAFDYAALGCTHHCYGDFALLKTIPGADLYYPASPVEFERLFRKVYKNGRINYFRLPEAQHGQRIPANMIEPGKAVVMKRGKDVTLIGLGPHLKTCLEAAVLLHTQGINAEVLYIHTVRPLDVAAIRRSLRKTGNCLVVEEHSKYGGLFDDVLRSTNDITGVRYNGVNIGNQFMHNYGTYGQHCESSGLTANNVAALAAKLIIQKPVWQK